MRNNNFDIVRLILATIVVFYHSAALSLSSSLAFVPSVFSGHVAVDGFFAISGFLIFASYDRCKSLKEYFTNRAFRILPGYWLSTVFCLLIAFSLGHFHVGKFLLANLAFANFLHPGIDGVFQSNPANPYMNGALWTIKVEVMFYLSVPFIAWFCRKLNRDAVLWTLIILSILYRVMFAHHESLSVQLPGQLSFFLIGTLIYYHLAFFKKHGLWMMPAAIICFALHAWTGWFFLRPFAVATLTMGASLLVPEIKGPTRWGDFSYGTYILHYPIIQIIVAAGLYNNHPWAAFSLGLLCVAVAAIFSWFVVEKPALAHSKSIRLRRAALGETANYPPAVP